MQGTLANDGTSDIGSTPGDMLLLRNLPTATTQEALFSKMAVLGVIHICLVRSKATHKSMGFAFAKCKNKEVSIANQGLARNSALNLSQARNNINFKQTNNGNICTHSKFCRMLKLLMGRLEHRGKFTA